MWIQTGVNAGTRPISGSIEHEGATHSIYRDFFNGFENGVPVSHELGYIVKWRAIVNGQTGPWNALEGAGRVSPAVWVAGGDGTSYQVIVESTWHLVKTGLFPHHRIGSFTLVFNNALNLRLYTSASPLAESGFPGSPHPEGTDTISSTVGTNPGTCPTPALTTVPLGTFHLGEMNGIGSATPPVPVELRNNCESSTFYAMRYVLYGRGPGGENLTPPDSILPLESTSTASGMGVQILHADGITPFPLGVEHGLAYDPNRDRGFQSLNLSARIIQTEANPTPGIIRAVLVYHVIYK